jgi:hypothetical protein
VHPVRFVRMTVSGKGGTHMATHLSRHHRTTVEQIFRHPTSGNVEWRAVRSLLDAVGTVVEEHNGHLKVTVGPETEIFHEHGAKDVDTQSIVDLRRMLAQAGLAPDGSPGVTDQRTRNYGDDRWGKPTQD